MKQEGETPPQTGDEMVHYDRFMTLTTLRVKSGSVSRYIIFSSDMNIRPGDQVLIKARKHGNERWYPLSSRATRFGVSSSGAYIPKTVWECMGAEEGDLLDIDVEVWYADDSGKQAEEGDKTVPEE